jgi:pimeloyl-ACP methyl ester carboxylesterase
MTTIRNHKKHIAAVRILLPLVLITAVAAVLAWRPWRSKAATVPPGAAAGGIFIKSCMAKIGGAEYAADCGTLVVPEFRGDPASRLIALPVQRIRSSAADPADPVFFLAGGPGLSNMANTQPAWLLARHDFVKVGYRGVDGTPRLDCPAFSKALHGFGGDLLGPASLDSIGRAAAACAAGLQAKGTDLRGYTIPEVVEDMEAARVALGYERVDLLSESYGTRVALLYAQMHPQSLLRSAMIGVNPPGHMLDHYADLCRRDAACAAHTSDLADTLRRVNRSMPESWLGIPIDPGKVRAVAHVMLYTRTSAPLVFDAYLAADRGDASGLALMSLAYDFILPDMMTWGEFLAVGGSADGEPGRDYRGEFASAGGILGAPMSELIWGSTPAGWPAICMDDRYRRVEPSDVETLLVGGSLDFATPAEFATEELLPFLKNGRQVILAEQGHVQDFWTFQPAAAERLLTGFFDTGAADDSLYEYLPMDFKAPIGFPLLAKILFGAVAVSTLGLSLAAVLIVSRIRRWKAATKA